MSAMTKNDLLEVSLVLSSALDVLNLLSDETTGETANKLNEAARNVQDAISFVRDAMTQ
jgi:hypothetical protein